MDTFYNGNQNYNNIYLEPLKYYLRGFNSSFFAEKVNNLSKFVNKEFAFSDAFRFSVGINNYCNVSGLKDKELKNDFTIHT